MGGWSYQYPCSISSSSKRSQAVIGYYHMFINLLLIQWSGPTGPNTELGQKLLVNAVRGRGSTKAELTWLSHSVTAKCGIHIHLVLYELVCKSCIVSASIVMYAIMSMTCQEPDNVYIHKKCISRQPIIPQPQYLWQNQFIIIA